MSSSHSAQIRSDDSTIHCAAEVTCYVTTDDIGPLKYMREIILVYPTTRVTPTMRDEAIDFSMATYDISGSFNFYGK